MIAPERLGGGGRWPCTSCNVAPFLTDSLDSKTISQVKPAKENKKLMCRTAHMWGIVPEHLSGGG